MANSKLILFLFACILSAALVVQGHNDDDDEDHSVPACTRGAWRSIDGSCNNVFHPSWGQAGFPFLHLEGTGPLPDHTPNERVVSNRIFAAPYGKEARNYTFAERRVGQVPDHLGRNHLFVAFSQMVSHDLGQNPLIFDFSKIFTNYQVGIIEPNDPLLEPGNPNNKTGIFTIRSFGTTDENGIFRSFNNASGYLDAAPIYGHFASTTDLLRSHVGGRLKTHLEAGTDLPRVNEVSNAVPNECGTFGDGNDAAGDLRVDENVILTALHTIWLKEHNYWADSIAAAHPSYTDEEVFQTTRAKVIAIWQHIVYDELLPALLGPFWHRIGAYDGYDDSADASVAASFATAAFRLVHSMVPLPALVLDSECEGIIPPLTPTRNNSERANCIPSFFAQVGIDAIIRGAVNQFAQAQDHIVVDGLRSVFQKFDSRGGNIDIEVSNIFRGREQRLVRFDALRQYYTGKSLYEERGCSAGETQDSLRCFLLITSNRSLATDLQSLYGRVSNIDAYVGLMVESFRYPYIYPPLASHILLEQFEKIRDGDWWWYENRQNGQFTRQNIREIRGISFADIMRRHSDVPISDDAFSVRSDCPLE